MVGLPPSYCLRFSVLQGLSSHAILIYCTASAGGLEEQGWMQTAGRAQAIYFCSQVS